MFLSRRHPTREPVVKDNAPLIRVLTILETRGKSATGAVRPVRTADQALRDIGIDQHFLGFGSIGETVASYHQLRAMRRDYAMVVINGLRPLAESKAVRYFARRCLRRGLPLGVYWHETQMSFEELDQASGGILSSPKSLLTDPNVFHLVTSQAAGNFTQSKTHDRAAVHVVYNCAPDPRSMPWLDIAQLKLAGDRPMVFAAGSINSRKAPDLFVEVCERVAKHKPDVLFAWAGTGPQREVDMFKQQIEDAGLGSNLIMLGYQDPPYLWQHAATVIAQPSRNDPLPLSTMEGLAAGRPIVCFDVDGFPELLGEAGSVIQPFDTDAFAMAVLHWLDQMATPCVHEPSRRVYEKFGQPEAFAARYADALRQQLRKDGI